MVALERQMSVGRLPCSQIRLRQQVRYRRGAYHYMIANVSSDTLFV